MPKVLIVDDSSFQRKCISRIMKDLSYEVVQAENGEEALEILKQEVPDLMIVDLLMPVMGGMELLERTSELYPDLEKMVVTSDIQKTVREKCNALGVSSFVNKPILKEKFVSEIKKAA